MYGKRERFDWSQKMWKIDGHHHEAKMNKERFYQKSQRKDGSVNTLISDFWVQELWKNNSYVLTDQACGILL